jgi:hypothetical protein
MSKTFNIFHPLEIQIQKINSKAMQVTLIEPPFSNLWISWSCLEWGKENYFETGLSTDVSVCEWLLTENYIL